MHGDNPYFAAFIALKPSEHTYFIAVIYRVRCGDLRYWFMNLRLYLFLLFISVNSRLVAAWIYAWFLWFTSFAYKKIYLYLCKANEEGRFCDFSAAPWETGAFFQTPLAPIPRQGRWCGNNIKWSCLAISLKTIGHRRRYFYANDSDRLEQPKVASGCCCCRRHQLREPALCFRLTATAPHPIHIIYIAAAHLLRIHNKLHIAYILQNVRD